MTYDWLTISFSIVLIVCGNLLLVGCLSQRNFDLINKPCPDCECNCHDEWQNPQPIEEDVTDYSSEVVGTFH